MEGLGRGNRRLPVGQRESGSESRQQPNRFLDLPQPQLGFSSSALKARHLGHQRELTVSVALMGPERANSDCF